MHKVFVYGSLKKGFGNHPLIDNPTTRLLGEYFLDGAEMFSLGSFPGVIRGEGRVTGELYEVDDSTLRDLDRLEGHPTFYERMPMMVTSGDTNERCEGYIYRGDVSRLTAIEDGEWTHDKINRRF